MASNQQDSPTYTNQRKKVRKGEITLKSKLNEIFDKVRSNKIQESVKKMADLSVPDFNLAPQVYDLIEQANRRITGTVEELKKLYSVGSGIPKQKKTALKNGKQEKHKTGSGIDYLRSVIKSLEEILADPPELSDPEPPKPVIKKTRGKKQSKKTRSSKRA